jgi:hypothetical protein
MHTQLTAAQYNSSFRLDQSGGEENLLILVKQLVVEKSGVRKEYFESRDEYCIPKAQ